MGKKRLTPNQQLMAFGATADREALSTAIESLRAIFDARFAATTIRPPRRKRADAGTKRGEGKANGEASSVEAA